MLGNLHNFTLTPTQLKRGLAHLGANHKLRRVLRDLKSGKANVSIGVIGTSVSWGTGASKRGATDWFSMLEHAIRTTFPSSSTTFRNGCFPGTPSSFASMCHRQMVDDSVDLLFVEYVTNDFAIDSMFKNPNMQAYERLLRKILKRPSHPAVVLLQFPTWGQQFPSNSSFRKHFHESAEDQYGTMSHYYDLPWLSYRNAVYLDAEMRSHLIPTGWSALTNDQVHPNDHGHRIILDLIMWLMLQTNIDLSIQPYSKIDAWHNQQPLPPPMHRQNYEESVEMCLLDDSLRSVVREEESHGWFWANEGTAEKPKRGYVTSSPNRPLIINLRLRSTGILDESISGDANQAEEDSKVALMFSYLKSYTGMGTARIECLRGCSCRERTVDAQHDQKTSTTFMQLVLLSVPPKGLQGGKDGGENCTVAVRLVENKTRGGGGKFKVSALMLMRSSAMSFYWDPDAPAPFVAEDIFKGRFETIKRETAKGGV